MTINDIEILNERYQNPYSKFCDELSQPFIGCFRTVEELFDCVKDLDTEKIFYPKIAPLNLSKEERKKELEKDPNKWISDVIIRESSQTPANFLIFGKCIAPEDLKKTFIDFEIDILQNLTPDIPLNIFIFFDYLNSGSTGKLRNIFRSLSENEARTSLNNCVGYFFYLDPNDDDEDKKEFTELFEELIGGKSIFYGLR